MYLRQLTIRGAPGAEAFHADNLGSLVSVPAAAAVGVADALAIGAATLSGDFASRAAGLGLPAAEATWDHGLLEQLQWPEPLPRGALGADGRVGVELVVELDPPLYGTLREHALRDPRLALGLASGPELTIKLGWLLSRDRTAVAASLHGVRVGDADLPASGPERPAWLAGFLGAVGRRLGRAPWSLDGLPERLLAASLSPDPDVRRRFQALSQAFAAPPFGWGALALVRERGLELRFGPDLLPLRRLGPAAPAAVWIAEAAWLTAPDVLVVESPVDPGLRAWLADRATADDATLEQIFVVEA